MSDLSSMNPKQLATLANAVALVLADDLSPDETNVLGNFIVAVGSILLTIAAQEAFQASAFNQTNTGNQSTKK